MSADLEWAAFPLRCIELYRDARFRVGDLTSRVKAEPGPVLFFRQTQSAPREQVQDSLKDCTVTGITHPANNAELLSDLRALRELFANSGGERFLPRRFVVIVLIVRKLYNGEYWGGSHNKNFICSDNIAKGRGVSPDFKDIAKDVANFLRKKGILIAKWGSGNRRRKKQKYALNPKRISDIESLVDGDCDESIRHWAYQDRTMITARYLDSWRKVT